MDNATDIMGMQLRQLYEMELWKPLEPWFFSCASGELTNVRIESLARRLREHYRRKAIILLHVRFPAPICRNLRLMLARMIMESAATWKPPTPEIVIPKDPMSAFYDIQRIAVHHIESDCKAHVLVITQLVYWRDLKADRIDVRQHLPKPFDMSRYSMIIIEKPTAYFGKWKVMDLLRSAPQGVPVIFVSCSIHLYPVVKIH